MKNDKATKIEYDVINIQDNKVVGDHGFSIEDLTESMISGKLNNTIIYVPYIMVTESDRNKGIGSKMLMEFVNKYDDDTIIIADAGALLDEYPEIPIQPHMEYILCKLSRFFVKNSFISINSMLSEYEVKETYIYNNKIGKTVIDMLTKQTAEYREIKHSESSIAIRYKMLWIEENETWVYLIGEQKFDSSKIKEGWVTYLVDVNKDGTIILDTYKRDNIGKLFTDAYDVSSWNIGDELTNDSEVPMYSIPNIETFINHELDKSYQSWIDDYNKGR